MRPGRRLFGEMAARGLFPPGAFLGDQAEASSSSLLARSRAKSDRLPSWQLLTPNGIVVATRSGCRPRSCTRALGVQTWFVTNGFVGRCWPECRRLPPSSPISARPSHDRSVEATIGDLASRRAINQVRARDPSPGVRAGHHQIASCTRADALLAFFLTGFLRDDDRSPVVTDTLESQDAMKRTRPGDDGDMIATPHAIAPKQLRPSDDEDGRCASWDDLRRFRSRVINSRIATHQAFGVVTNAQAHGKPASVLLARSDRARSARRCGRHCDRTMTEDRIAPPAIADASRASRGVHLLRRSAGGFETGIR